MEKLCNRKIVQTLQSLSANYNKIPASTSSRRAQAAAHILNRFLENLFRRSTNFARSSVAHHIRNRVIIYNSVERRFGKKLILENLVSFWTKWKLINIS